MKCSAISNQESDKAKLCAAYGVQNEYVLPDALLAKTAELKKHFDARVEYVSGLKPKPTTKKKAI